jgi:uncharacterized repeat protein (TIGR04076 family)
MFPQPRTLTIDIFKVDGFCPTYQVRDTFQIVKGFQLQSIKKICLHALQALAPYYIPLSLGISPYDLGLATKEANQKSNEAYFQCHDPEKITGGGSVLFRVRVD